MLPLSLQQLSYSVKSHVLLMTRLDPYAMHFSLINVSDLVLVNEEGEVQEPTPHTVNKAGFIIHSTLHALRPDINAAVHLHSPHGRAWSAFGRPVEQLVQGEPAVLLLPGQVPSRPRKIGVHTMYTY